MEVTKKPESPANFPRLYQVRSDARAPKWFPTRDYAAALPLPAQLKYQPDIIKLTTSIWSHASGNAYNADPVKKKDSSVLEALFFLKFRDLAFSNSAEFYDASVT